MPKSTAYLRLNIYLDGPDLRQAVKLAAARHGLTLSAYCLQAIRHRLAEEGLLPVTKGEEGPREAAHALDRLRAELGPIGVPVSDLIRSGRRP